SSISKLDQKCSASKTTKNGACQGLNSSHIRYSSISKLKQKRSAQNVERSCARCRSEGSSLTTLMRYLTREFRAHTIHVITSFHRRKRNLQTGSKVSPGCAYLVFPKLWIGLITIVCRRPNHFRLLLTPPKKREMSRRRPNSRLPRQRENSSCACI